MIGGGDNGGGGTGVEPGWQGVGGKGGGGRRCRRRHFWDTHLLRLVAGFKQKQCVFVLIFVSLSVQGLVLRQDGRQVLQKGRNIFRNGPVCRRRPSSGGSRGLWVLARRRSLIVMMVVVAVIAWLGELLEKVV